jgi:hypothetical protein
VCKSQQVARPVVLGLVIRFPVIERASHQGVPFTAGDWERVSVLVCKNQQRARRVVLSQHGWNQHLNCDEGECTFNGAQSLLPLPNRPLANPYPASV